MELAHKCAFEREGIELAVGAACLECRHVPWNCEPGLRVNPFGTQLNTVSTLHEVFQGSFERQTLSLTWCCWHQRCHDQRIVVISAPLSITAVQQRRRRFWGSGDGALHITLGTS